MLKRLLAAAIVILSTIMPVTAIAAEPDGGGVSCARNGCTEHARDAAQAGSASADVPPNADLEAGDASSTNGDSAAAPDPCAYRALPTQPAVESPLWGGNDPASGQVEYTPCLSNADGSLNEPYRFAANAPVGPVIPQISPAELAQEASQRISIPNPEVQFGPDPNQVAVKVPVWMWVNEVEPAPLTVTAGAVSVTATPHLESISWSMGDPINPSNSTALADPVVCAGESMYMNPGSQAADVQSPCSYTYIWKSTAERTGGTEKWPVTATATWVITWTASTGEAGQVTAPPAVTATTLRVGQWTAIGVPGPAG